MNVFRNSFFLLFSLMFINELTNISCTGYNDDNVKVELSEKKVYVCLNGNEIIQIKNYMYLLTMGMGKISCSVKELTDINNKVTVQISGNSIIITGKQVSKNNKIKIQCEVGKNMFFSKLVKIKVLGSNYKKCGGGDEISDDPHFIQSVYDTVSQEEKNICYDYVGHADEIINLVEKTTQDNLNLKVSAQLLDDYYIHRILIDFGIDKVIISVTDIKSYIDGKMAIFNWPKWYTFSESLLNDNMMIKFAGMNQLKIIFWLDRLHDAQPYEILVSNHDGKHLDISVNKKFQTATEGLLGKVYNGYYAFGSPIQDDGNLHIGVNDQSINAVKKVRFGNECYFVERKHLFDALK